MRHILAWTYFGVILITTLYCELLADFVKLQRCNWPNIPNSSEKTLRTLIIADTHLLGPLRGHWLDKLYREWHMKRAYQAAIIMLQPEVVFVLGDLFDEGDKANSLQFEEFIRRFSSHFRTPAGVPIVSAVGNHDVGFHYRMHNYFMDRFEKAYNNTGAQLYSFKGIHFVLLNSMSMENDNCQFCEATMLDLAKISVKLKHQHHSRPILMQHFPTYRISDGICREHDSQDIEKLRVNWDVLSKEATDLLGDLLHPRVAFAGHTHHYCLNINRFGVEEYTVSSLNWRNNINPSILLASFTPSKYAVAKCDILNQEHVYAVYIVVGVSLVLIEFLKYKFRKSKNTKNQDLYKSC